MKILITGSNGYLGSYLVDKYKSLHEIYTISKKQDISPNVKKNFVGDLADINFVNSIKLNVDYIINCAANTNHYENYKKSYQDNCKSVINLINNKDLIYKKLIHISTEAVFLSNYKISVSEKSEYPKKNLTPYSRTKKLSEYYVKKYSIKNNREYNILRTRLIWDTKKSPVFKKLNNAINKKIFFFVDKGDYYTSATHIENLSTGIIKCIENGINGNTYFITDGEKVKFYWLIKKIINNDLKFKKIYSLPRSLIYFLCLMSEKIYLYSNRKIKLPLSLSLYYLTMCEVKINNKHSQKELKYFPKSFY